LKKFKVNVPINHEKEYFIDAENEDEAWDKAFKLTIESGVPEGYINDWLVERALGIEEFAKEWCDKCEMPKEECDCE